MIKEELTMAKRRTVRKAQQQKAVEGLLFKGVEPALIDGRRVDPILWRDFQGRKSDFNPNGKRTFSIRIDNMEEAERLRDIGWNVRPRFAYDDDSVINYYTLKVTVNFDSPVSTPVINLVSDRSATRITAENASELDNPSLHFKWVDARVNPYFWEMNGRSGITAYLDKMNIFVETDLLDERLRQYEEEHFNTGETTDPDLEELANEDVPF